jgi:hypothetical protein
MSGAWLRYDAWTLEDGRIRVSAQTNDNNDDGYDDGESTEWGLTLRDRAAFDRQIGRSRVGISGIRVTVELDGARL